MSLGLYYVIRHKASGELMPELVRGRGYSWWNPSSNKYELNPKKYKGTPRLLSSRNQAARVIAQWNCNPNSRMGITRSYEGEEDYSVDSKPDGRKKEDLEVISVYIEEYQPVGENND